MHPHGSNALQPEPQPDGDAHQLADTPPMAAVDRLAPSSQGTYALYEPPDGSIHLVYRAQGATEDGHLHLPAAMVRMAKSMAEGKSILPGPLGKIMQRAMTKSQA